LLATVNLPCNEDVDWYIGGMTVVQLMWKLLNNRMCFYNAQGKCTTSGSPPTPLPNAVQRINQSVIDGFAAEMGREAFVFAITAGFQEPDEFLGTMLFYLWFVRGTYWTGNDYSRLVLAFQQHGF
jgi:hypothetical protein